MNIDRTVIFLQCDQCRGRFRSPQQLRKCRRCGGTLRRVGRMSLKVADLQIKIQNGGTK